MPLYAKIDSANTALQPVLGFYDTDALTYAGIDFKSADYIEMTSAQWSARLDNPYYDPSTKSFGATPPAPTLEQAQATQLATMAAAYASAIQQPVAFTNAAGTAKTYQADPGSVSNLQNMLLAYQGTKTVPSGFYWVSEDNTQVPFTYADMEGLATTMGNQGLAAFQNLQTKKAAINAATTVAQVQTVTWS